MSFIINKEEIARQFVNEARTRVGSPQPYPQWRNAAQELADKLKNVNRPEAILMAEEVLWYRDLFAEMSPRKHISDDERNKYITEFLVLVNKYTIYLLNKQKGPSSGLRLV